MPTPENLTQLRLERGWSKVDAARALRLGTDVWDKFEQGVIQPDSLTRGQVAQLAGCFAVSATLFLTLLKQSHPQPPGVCQRWGATPGTPAVQSIVLALERSTMPPQEKRFWSALWRGANPGASAPRRPFSQAPHRAAQQMLIEHGHLLL